MLSYLLCCVYCYANIGSNVKIFNPTILLNIFICSITSEKLYFFKNISFGRYPKQMTRKEEKPVILGTKFSFEMFTVCSLKSFIFSEFSSQNNTFLIRLTKLERTFYSRLHHQVIIEDWYLKWKDKFIYSIAFLGNYRFVYRGISYFTTISWHCLV